MAPPCSFEQRCDHRALLLQHQAQSRSR